MIDAEIEFPHGTLIQLVQELLSLPTPLRPTHHKLGENEKGTLIKSPASFIHSLKNVTPGPWLTNRRCEYVLSVPGAMPITCSCGLDIEPELVKLFMIRMANLNPFFGFACALEERVRRNRVKIVLEAETIESWVGRDSERYIPSLYWLTLLPERLAKKHGVPLKVLEQAALEHVTLPHGQHLFRFYEKPDDWSASQRVPELIASLSGIFDIESIKPQLAAVKTYQELDAILKPWE